MGGSTVKSGSIKSNQLKAMKNLRDESRMNKTVSTQPKRPAWNSPIKKQTTNPHAPSKKPNFDHGGRLVSKSHTRGATNANTGERETHHLLRPTVSSSNKQLKKVVSPSKKILGKKWCGMRTSRVLNSFLQRRPRLCQGRLRKCQFGLGVCCPRWKVNVERLFLKPLVKVQEKRLAKVRDL